MSLGVGTAVSLALPGAGLSSKTCLALSCDGACNHRSRYIEGVTPGATGLNVPAASTLAKAEQFVVNKATGKTFDKAIVDATKSDGCQSCGTVNLQNRKWR
jgi:hypothetical protein